MKLLKNETENELTIEIILHAKQYFPTLDKTRCTGCGICMVVCPRENFVRKRFSWRVKN